MAGLLPCRCSDDTTEFRAGDVQIKGGGGCEASAALRSQAARLLAPYCGDDQFAFLGVKG